MQRFQVTCTNSSWAGASLQPTGAGSHVDGWPVLLPHPAERARCWLSGCKAVKKLYCFSESLLEFENGG